MERDEAKWVNSVICKGMVDFQVGKLYCILAVLKCWSYRRERQVQSRGYSWY